MSLDAKAKAETIDSLAQALRDGYTFPELGDQLAKMLKERQAHGDYDAIANAKDFGEVLTKQLAEVAHDRHLRVFYSAQVLPPMHAPGPGGAPPPEMRERMRLMQEKTNYGFEKAELLRGNVGYLKLNGFTDAERGGATAAGTMNFLANTDALIIDLRQNGGGTPEMVALLASYLFSGDDPVHLNDLVFRKEGTRDSEVLQSWTLPYVPGKRYVDKEVYLLTSHFTFSAAEEFTYDLQALKRATIVGETTGGGANPGGPHRLGDHFSAFIPGGHAINPVTKTNWEGKGVDPDIKTSQEDALKTAHRTALEHLIAKTTDAQQLGILKQALAGVEAEAGEKK